MPRPVRWLPLLLVVSAAQWLPAAPAPVTVRLRSGAAPAVPDDFVGLSFEMQQVLPDASGEHFFRPTNRALIETLDSLGVRSVRVGGNTTDNPAVAVPAPADLDALFAFARAANVRIIYTLRLRKGRPEGAARLARYIVSHYGALLDCFAIGNEPDIYDHTYQDYLAEFKTYLRAITAPGMAPGALFCAPSTTPDEADWARRFARDLGSSGRIRYVSQHEYPGGNGRRAGDPAAARRLMLSPQWVAGYQSVYDSFVPVARAAGLPYRIEETNSYYNGGADRVSNTLAAALWGLDYLCWWAEHGAAGLNFHTGDWVAAADDRAPCRYAVFRTAAHGYEVKPLGYALKAYALAKGERAVPVQMARNPEAVNLTAYAFRSGQGELSLILINKDRERSAQVEVEGALLRAGQELFLSAPGGPAATDGLTLGGAAIGIDGTWSGGWSSTRGSSEVIVPPCTAALVKVPYP